MWCAGCGPPACAHLLSIPLHPALCIWRVIFTEWTNQGSWSPDIQWIGSINRRVIIEVWCLCPWFFLWQAKDWQCWVFSPEAPSSNSRSCWVLLTIPFTIPSGQVVPMTWVFYYLLSVFLKPSPTYESDSFIKQSSISFFEHVVICWTHIHMEDKENTSKVWLLYGCIVISVRMSKMY